MHPPPRLDEVLRVDLACVSDVAMSAIGMQKVIVFVAVEEPTQTCSECSVLKSSNP